MIKLNSVNQIRKSLSDFENRTAPNGALDDHTKMIDEYFSRLGKSIMVYLFGKPAIAPGPFHMYYDEKCQPLLETLEVKIDLDALPDYLDFSSLSFKASALKGDKRLPHWFVAGDDEEFWHQMPPYGKIHIITETAGKLRFICPYNTPFIHSTGLYSRCRAIMQELRQDCSDDQSVGHRFVQKELAKGDGMYVSADLSNFSDDISVDLISFGLRSLGLEQLGSYLFNLPVTLPNGKFITPNKLLMGLKGCFELSTLCHHYVVQRCGIKRYTMCGDDLFFKGDIEPYLESLLTSGWKLNRAKTVVSPTVAVFCGEMYWFGRRVSPTVPKVSSCFKSNLKPHKAAVLFSVLRSSIEQLNKVYNRRGVVIVISPIVRLLRKVWNDLIVLEFPQKLRGLGLRISRPYRSLLGGMRKSGILRMSKLSIGIKREQVERQRWFGLPIELSSNIEPVSPYFPSLLKRGGVSLDVSIAKSAAKKDVRALNHLEIFEWFYYHTRLEPNQFNL
jgi:hypothetical protein